MIKKAFYLIICCNLCYSPSWAAFGKSILTTSNNIELSFNYEMTTHLIHPPYVSAVLDDPTDPVTTKGIFINVTLSGNNPIFEAVGTSDNKDVVKDENIFIVKNQSYIQVKITPSQIGYSNIKIEVNQGKSTGNIMIYFACSASDHSFEKTIWHTGISDASAAIALDDNQCIIADDEKNGLYLYQRDTSGLPLAEWKYDSLIYDLKNNSESKLKEMDCEAATKSFKDPKRIFWIGSMSNGGKSFKIEESRNKLFATDLERSGSKTNIHFVGCINSLRDEIVKWGDANNLSFGNSAKYGASPKEKDGFNIEGMTFAPDSSTLYICLRAPLNPNDSRTSAIIVPILHFEEWFNNGHPVNKPTFDLPIILNLGERGFRDIIQLKNKQYLIIAGSCDEKRNGTLYFWSGRRNDVPIEFKDEHIKDLNPETAIEITNSNGEESIELISDCGKFIYYNDNVTAKYLKDEFKKFRSDIIKVKKSNIPGNF